MTDPRGVIAGEYIPDDDDLVVMVPVLGEGSATVPVVWAELRFAGPVTLPWWMLS